LEDPKAIKALFDDQIARFCSAEGSAEAEHFAEAMVNIYHRDKPMYDAWRLAAQAVGSQTTLNHAALPEIRTALSPRVSLKVYELYLALYDQTNADLIPPFLLSEDELNELAHEAEVPGHDLRDLVKLNERVRSAR
jgi:hypothetical protein